MFEHIKFENKELSNYIDDFKMFLNFLSMNNFEMPTMLSYRHLWSATTPGIDSSIKTLDGIKELVGICDFIDCYVLLRKLRDNLLFDCVIALDAESNHPYINDDLFKSVIDDKGNIDMDEFQSAMHLFLQINKDDEETNEDKKRLIDWKNNIRRKKDDKIDDWIGYKHFMDKLERNPKIYYINKKYLFKRIKRLQNETNSYVHSLSFDSSNNFSVSNKEHINNIMYHLQTIKMMIVSYLMIIKSRIFSGGAYVAALEAGLEPEEGSQYWMPDGVIDALKEIKEYNPSLLSFLHKNNSNGMDFGEVDPDA